LDSAKIVNKLKLLIALPLIVLFLVSLVMIDQFYNNLSALRQTNRDIKTIKVLTDTMTQLQKERGLSSSYIESKKFTPRVSAKLYKVYPQGASRNVEDREGSLGYKKIHQQRLLTDRSIENLHSVYTVDYAGALHNGSVSDPMEAKQLASISRISPLRNQVDNHTISSYDEFTQYTNIIQTLFNHYILIITKMKNNTITKEFAPFTSLLVMQESLGELRGSFNAVFSKHKCPSKATKYPRGIDKKLYYLAMHAKGQYDIAQQRYITIAPHNFIIRFNKIVANKNYLWVHKRINKYLIDRPKTIKENPNEWFKKNTSIISQLIDVRKIHLAFIQKTIQTLYSNYIQKILLYIVILLFITLFMIFLGLKIKNSILEKISLLKQYKDIVDRSSIVSKTDTHGRIIYANDKFCSISGYTREELLGKSHNIVRHPDMPKSAFKAMWETIQAKKPWEGIVKNRKKDGSSYTVEATINPILDAQGNIIEYIALRNDITDVINLHEEIEQTQEEMILKMGEIGETRSRETGHHVKRVAKYSEILAKYYGLEEEEIKNLTIASPMHDIGKVAIPDSILNKPGKLTQEEWKVMQKHSEIGHELFQNSDRALLKAAAIIAYEHHEKYNGSGYPQGLTGEKIHIYGRITALADVFDALGSDRCYKKAWDDEKTFKLIKEGSGEHFDPKLVKIFFEHLDEFLAIRNKYSDESSFMQEN